MSENTNNDMFDRLEALTAEFNPAPGFGLMGQLQNGDPQQMRQGLPSAAPASAPPASAPPAADATNPQMISDVVAPLNDNVQDLSKRFAALEQQMRAQQPHPTDLRQTPATPVAPAATSTEGMSPEQVRQMEFEASQKQMQIDLAWERARNYLNDARIQFPQANLSEDDLRDVWQKGKMTDHPETAKNLDWKNHWNLEAKSRAYDVSVPQFGTMEKQLKAMQDELSAMKTQAAAKPNVADMGAVSQSSRRILTPGDSNKTVITKGPNGEEVVYNKNVYERAKERQGRNGFAGFNKILNEEAQREALSLVS
jgi:hypothetical protein